MRISLKEARIKGQADLFLLILGIDVKLVEDNEKSSESSGKSAFSFISGKLIEHLLLERHLVIRNQR